jgi:hypothetical protein
MNAKHWSGALLVLFALGCPAPAQEALVWKAFNEKDKVFYQKMRTRTVQKMKVAGTEVIQSQDQTFWVSWTPRAKKGRDWVVVQKIEGVKMEIEIGGNKIHYDSTAAEGPETPMSSFFKTLVGAEFTLTLGPDNKGDLTVKEVAGQADLIKKLSATNPELKPLLDNILSEDAVRKMHETALFWTPSVPVKAGDAWEKKSVLDLGPIGSYATTHGYTYMGKEERMDKIQVSAVMKYTAPAKKVGLPFAIKDADLKNDAKATSGVILFDREKGRVASARLHMELAGTLTIEVKGEESRVELTQSQDSTLESTDFNPIQDTKEIIKLELKDGQAQVAGSLTKDDPKDKVRKDSYCKVYAVELSAGQSYQIDLAAKDVKQFDPYLRLETTDGRQLAEDDDSGGNLDARIVFRPAKDGKYRIIVLAFKDQTGEFTLTCFQQSPFISLVPLTT